MASKNLWQTHYERGNEYLGPYREEARKLVREQGWHAYFNAMATLGQKPSTKGNFLKTAIARKLGAINLAIVERALSEAATPYEYVSAMQTDFMQEYLRFSQVMWRDNYHDPQFFESALLTNMVQSFSIISFERTGKRTYEVSPGLSERLRNTELRGLKTDDLRMPYPSIYVTIPQGEEFPLKLYNQDTGWHPLEGFYLTEDPVGNDPKNPIRTWRFMFCGPSKNPDEPFDDALFHFAVDLPTGITLEEALQREGSKVRRDTSLPKEVTDIFAEEWRKLFDWALNVIMYITWPEVEMHHVKANHEAELLWNRIQKLQSGKKRDALKQQYKTMQSGDRILLGRSIPRWLPSDTGESAPHAAVRYSRKRVLVQGFWQRQVYGEGRALRKWRYQPPYWRNLDAEEESSRTHRLV